MVMPTTWTGERIRALRCLLNITQVELANTTGFSQSLISQVENGTKLATDELLDAISSATGTPRRFFDVIPPDLPLATLRFRKLATAKRTNTRRIEALLTESYRITLELFNLFPQSYPSLPTATKNVSISDIEALAAESREALGIGHDGPIGHVTRAFERSGIAVAPMVLTGEDTEQEGTIGHFGVSCWPGTYEPAFVGYFPSSAGDRQRYTLAHELGHIVLHSKRRIVEDPEGEANRFAGAFLLPSSRAVEAMSVSHLTLSDFAHLKAYWGVSIQALIMRGAQLGLIDEARKISLFKQIACRGWRRQEPVRVYSEEPTLLWRLLLNRFGAQAIYSRASEDLGIHALILRSIAPWPSNKSGNKAETSSHGS
jgi:Zn-dependent peptidase ImmA (M78 family)